MTTHDFYHRLSNSNMRFAKLFVEVHQPWAA